MIEELSDRQLEAYNSADLGRFAACYHPEVTIFRPDGTIRLQGMDAFLEAYRHFFDKHVSVQARVDQRLTLGPHVVEREHWSREDKATGERTEGTLLVRYTESEGLIRWVEFLAPD